MDINVFESTDELARAAAEQIASEVRERPSAVLALPTGRTPITVYEELVRLHRSGRADFSHATFFGLDEFVGIPADHPGSFRQFLERHLFRPLTVNPTRIHFLNGVAPDLDIECERYERELDEAGGIDVLMLGIGANGHIGFNEPDETLRALTHRVSLHDKTRRDNALQFGNDLNRVPQEALSMGMATMLRASRIMLMAMGARKARCIERSVRGPLTTRLPASFLQMHRAVKVYLDREAASLLREPAGEVTRDA